MRLEKGKAFLKKNLLLRPSSSELMLNWHWRRARELPFSRSVINQTVRINLSDYNLWGYWLEKLFVFLKYLNKKLPKREGPNIDDITSLIDLDSFRIEETFKGEIILESKDREFEPLVWGLSNTFVEDELDIQIIQRTN